MVISNPILRLRWVAVLATFMTILGCPASPDAQVAVRELLMVACVESHEEARYTNSGDSSGGTSELVYLAQGMIIAYQELISSRSASTCNFEPSCSEYARRSLETHSPIVGLLKISDRLQRCHGLPGMTRHYEMDHSTGRLSDPVEQGTAN